MSKRVFSGIQSTGTPHIGNYLGAIKNWVEIQHNYDSIFCIVDLHAITIDRKPEELRHNSMEAVKDLLASGLDPEVCILFVQSHVPAHAELGWIFQTLTPMSELERMTQFKDKSGLVAVKDVERKLHELLAQLSGEVDKFKESTIESVAQNLTRRLLALPKTAVEKVKDVLNSEINPLETVLNTIDEYQEKIFQFQKQNKINAGLFAYPALMAADILLYHAEVVPVGEDQLQHIELTRIIAKKFNQKYGDYFPEPAAKITEAKRIMSLSDPTKKMSKSHGSANYIALDDDPDVIRKKIRKAVTDTGLPGSDGMAPGVRNLFDLLKYLDRMPDHERLLKEYQQGSLKYVELKDAVADAVIEELTPIQERRAQISDDEVKRVVQLGAQKANAIAQSTMREVKERVGFIGS